MMKCAEMGPMGRRKGAKVWEWDAKRIKPAGTGVWAGLAESGGWAGFDFD